VSGPDPRSTDRFDPKLFMTYVRQAGHSGALGIGYVGHGDDWAELSLPYDERLIGMVESGIVASGPIVSLMDMATGLAIWIRLGKFRHQATLDLRVDYLRPARPGQRIVGRGICYGLTRSVGFVRGLAQDGDPEDLVANVTGTFMFTE
jgi:uncharacterized protein (TIGR00369 family)